MSFLLDQVTFSLEFVQRLLQDLLVLACSVSLKAVDRAYDLPRRKCHWHDASGTSSPRSLKGFVSSKNMGA